MKKLISIFLLASSLALAGEFKKYKLSTIDECTSKLTENILSYKITPYDESVILIVEVESEDKKDTIQTHNQEKGLSIVGVVCIVILVILVLGVSALAIV